MKIFCIVCLLTMNFVTHARIMKSRGNTFNPDIGINLLFLNENSSSGNRAEDGIRLQEAELQFSSDVDVYFTAKAYFAIASEDGEYGIEPEEVYVETISVPYVRFRAGKSKMPIGKHNQLHSHAFPFVNLPLVNEEILGDEGLNITAVGASGLIPLPWFSEVTVNYAQGGTEGLFESDRKENKTLVARVTNLWDVSDSTTFELGLSGARGKNEAHLDTTLQGLDFTLKWRPTRGGKYRSFEWSFEYLKKNSEKENGRDKASGYFSYAKYQLAKRWYAQYRYDHLKSDETTKRHTALIAFLPSEFSGLRLQYERRNNGQDESERRLSLQLNISIGAHPAHGY